jgi:3-dehydroquinate synthase
MIVRHFRGSYAVEAKNLADALESLPEDARVISDANVWHRYGERVSKCLPSLVLEPGEATKSIVQFERCLEWLAGTCATRKTRVVALGGGVIGDLAGYVAASYMRGVPFVQIPTTLLSMVDSSVGGKVAIDLKSGKNLAGAFWAPESVSICLEVLKTLPDRQFAAGMAEIWKTGYIIDVDLLKRLRTKRLSVDSESLSETVMRCIDLKRQVVEEDEFETTGRRAILNFGHTIGHAIEQVTKYELFLHGEAISIGMVLEARLGELIGITPIGLSREIEADLASAGLPTVLPNVIQASELVRVMYRDKKADTKALAFSLLEGLGTCKLTKGVPEAEVLGVFGNG